MIGAEHLDPLEAAALGAADGDRPAVEAVAEDLLERGGDPERGLAGADHQHAAAGVEPVADAVDDQLVADQRDRPLGRAKTSQAASPAEAIRSASRRASRSPREQSPSTDSNWLGRGGAGAADGSAPGKVA